MTINTQNPRNWTRYSDTPPTEAGIYEWRVPSKAVPGMVLIVAAKMRMRGAGFETVLSPEFDYWTGYRVLVQCDVEWRHTNFVPEKSQRTPHVLSIEGLEISPCSHCGNVPTIEASDVSRYGGIAISPDPWNLNTWRFSCCNWGSTPRMSDPREIERIRLEARSNKEAHAIQIEAFDTAIAARDLEIESLRFALKMALEYWSGRQQRYKNKSPVWVQKARAALNQEQS